MTDQVLDAETNSASPSLDEIFNGKNKPEASKKTDSEDKTKADNQEADKVKSTEETKAQPQVDPELEKLKRRLEDTQKWGNSQRQATLKIINGLKEKGLSDEEIAETVGGQDIFNAVMKGTPVEQELNNPMAVVEQAFQQQSALAAATLKEMGHTEEELAEFMAAFNTLAYDQKEHRDEMYRRATSGDGSVAAYALKVGKEKLEEYRLAQTLKTKGVKAYEQELREQLKAELMQELESTKASIKEELSKSSSKPRLVGGQPVTTNNNSTSIMSIKDIFGQ